MRNLIFVLSLIIVFKVRAFPLESKNGKTEFTAIGRPAAIKIVGYGAGPTGDLSLIRDGANCLLSGDANLDLDTFDTGIGMRDQHMKEKYLETGKMKTATLKFIKAGVPASIIDSGGEVKLPAVLLLHGMEKPVQVQVVFSQEKDGIRAVSQFTVQISDFAIPVPSFSGITVADSVQIKVESLMAKNILPMESTEKK